VGRLVIEADRLGGPAALPSAVGDGRGLAPVVGGSAAPGVVVRPLDPALVLPLELVWREPAGPALQQLVALLTGPDQAAVTGA
jgi:hypothetical protein